MTILERATPRRPARQRCSGPVALDTATQLDLFAETDARECDQRITAIPCLFTIDGRGLAARIAAFDAWVTANGRGGCYARSHAWHPAWCGGATVATAACAPTVLMADLRCRHPDDGACCCVGDLLYRAACRHCDHEGPVRDSENAAAEDAHDHAWPGWRSLPLAPRPPQGGSSAARAAIARWGTALPDGYPPGWVEAGGPIRTRRRRYGTRHVPAATPWGGYDLCGEVTSVDDR